MRGGGGGGGRHATEGNGGGGGTQEGHAGQAHSRGTQERHTGAREGGRDGLTVVLDCTDSTRWPHRKLLAELAVLKITCMSSAQSRSAIPACRSGHRKLPWARSVATFSSLSSRVWSTTPECDQLHH